MSSKAEQQRRISTWRARGTPAPRRRTSRRLSGDPAGPESPGDAISGPDPWEVGQTVGQRCFLELDLGKAPRQIVVVGLHVEVPMSGEVEQDHPLLPGIPSLDRLVDDRTDRDALAPGRHDPLGPGELYAASNTGFCVYARASMCPCSTNMESEGASP